MWFGFIYALVMVMAGVFYRFLPFQYVSWGRKNRTANFDIKEWQGHTKYRLDHAAALWAELPPDRPDDPFGKVSFRRISLETDLRFGHLECDDPKNINSTTLIKADGLRDYAEKYGQIPEFLKNPA